MFRMVVFFAAIGCCSGALGQSLDTLVSPVDSLLQFERPDSLLTPKLQRLDSIQQQTHDQLARMNNSYDSVQNSFNKRINRLQLAQDSLKRLNLPSDHLAVTLDSLQGARRAKLDSIHTRAENLKKNAITKVNQLELPPQVSDRVKQYTASLDKVDIAMPAGSVGIPGLDLPELGNLKLPTLSSMPNASIPGLDIPKGMELPGMGDVKGVTGDLGNVTGEINGIQKEIPTDISGADKLIESKAGDLAEVKALDNLPTADNPLGNTPGNPMSNLPGNPLGGKPLDQQAVQDQLSKAAVDHFAGKEAQLKEAMEKLSKYKQKYSSVQSIKDLPKKVPNPLREKPFIERVVEGISLQVFRKDDWMLDAAPYLGYRFTERLTAGFGWNQRVIFGSPSTMQSRVYGPRVYGEFKVIRGIAGRLEVETMNTYVRRNLSSAEGGSRQWVPAVLAGMKKEYKIYQRLKGTAFVLYNFYNPHYKSPYGDRLNVRFGFEYSLKKKKKVTKPAP